MIVDARAEAWARLQLAGLAPRALFDLLRAFGSAQGVLDATPAQRRRHVQPESAALLDGHPSPRDSKRHSRGCASPGTTSSPGTIPAIRARFSRSRIRRPCFTPRGVASSSPRPAFAIVGSRNATPQGCEDAEAFAAALSAAGFTIVSGLALGIDAAAHRGGLRHAASSIAVIGTGPDRIYPARNRDLAHKLAANGLVISGVRAGNATAQAELSAQEPPVSGLSRGVLVVEATLSSGSLITARLAAEQGREVFALPGSIHSPFSKGGHRLIRDGAKLVETAQDILDELLVAAAPAPGVAAPKSREIADPHARAIVCALGHDPTDVDALVARTGFSASVVIAALTALELDREVTSLPGGRWQRISRRA
jgi:DNA processing protein